MNKVIFILAVIIAVMFVSYKKWTNISILSLSAAFVLGYLLCGLKVKTMLSFLPLSTMYDIFILTLFFGYAVENGTFSLLMNNILYHFRMKPHLIMPLMYLLSFLVAFIGPGIMAVAFMAPFTYKLAKGINAPASLAYITVAMGCTWGSNFLRSSGGAVVYRLLSNDVYSNMAFSITMKGFLWTGVITTAIFVFYYLKYKGWKTKELHDIEVEPLNTIQKKNAVLILIVICFSLLPYLLNSVADIGWLKRNLELFDIPIVMTIGSLIASIMKFADDKRVLKEQVSWSVIVMIGAMDILIGIGEEVGMMAVVSDWLNHVLSALWISPLLALVGSIMNIFTSAIAVAIPTLFSLVPEYTYTNNFLTFLRNLFLEGLKHLVPLTDKPVRQAREPSEEFVG